MKSLPPKYIPPWKRNRGKKAGTVFQESAVTGRTGKLTDSNHVLSYNCVAEYNTTAPYSSSPLDLEAVC